MTTIAAARFPLALERIRVALSSAIRSITQWGLRNAIAVATFVLASAVFSFREVYNHLAYRTNSYDLAIFGQGIKGYSEGRGPISEVKGIGYSLLGDHFSPINALLGPIYALVPSIEVLLIAQAILIALGAVPLITWAQRDLGRWPALAVGAIFVTSFGVSSAVGFDFHEVAWAVPMLSVSLSALGQRRFRLAALSALPLVLVKEDLGLTLAMIGVVLALRGRRVLGASVAVFGVAATALEVRVLIPFFNASGTYDYSGQAGGFTLSALWHQSPDVTNIKITTLLLTFSVGLFIATRSTMVLIAAPTLLWRFAGSNPGYWTTNFQYSLVLMPVLVAGLVEVLVRERRRNGSGARPFIRWALAGSVALNLVMGLMFPMGSMLRASFWNVDPRVHAQREAVAIIPAGATVAATNYLVPQLVDTTTTSLFTAASVQAVRPQWIAADMTNTWPDSPEQRASALMAAMDQGYKEVWRKDDVMVLRDTRQ